MINNNIRSLTHIDNCGLSKSMMNVLYGCSALPRQIAAPKSTTDQMRKRWKQSKNETPEPI